MFETTEIFLHGFGEGAKTLRQRFEMRKTCGPYRRVVPSLVSGRRTEKQNGTGFYFDRHGQMNSADSAFRLRVYDALPQGHGMVTGYYADEFGDTIIRPYVLALPHGRGFLAAYGEGAGMWGSVEFNIYDSLEEAGYVAHSLAENAAERERDYRENEQLEEEEENAE
jgi:hypothetical protein